MKSSMCFCSVGCINHTAPSGHMQIPLRASCINTSCGFLMLWLTNIVLWNFSKFPLGVSGLKFNKAVVKKQFLTMNFLNAILTKGQFTQKSIVACYSMIGTKGSSSDKCSSTRARAHIWSGPFGRHCYLLIKSKKWTNITVNLQFLEH